MRTSFKVKCEGRDVTCDLRVSRKPIETSAEPTNTVYTITICELQARIARKGYGGKLPSYKLPSYPPTNLFDKFLFSSFVTNVPQNITKLVWV